MKTVRTLLPILMALAFILSSCNKDEDDTNNTTTNPGNPVPSYSDADGVLAAIQVISYQTAPIIGEIAVYADASTAAFFESSSSYYDAGTVSVNTYDLNKLDNNSYVLPSTGSTQIDFDFSSSSTNSWSVSGGTNVSAFTYTTPDEMPYDVKFSGDYSTVNTGSNLVVSLENYPINTDSILFVVAFNTTSVTKTVGGGLTSATFTSAELSGASGTGVVQAAAYNYSYNDVSGKRYYFINESVVSQVASFE